MSKDLFLGKTKRNWGREPAASNPEFAVKAAATRQEAQIAKLKDLKAKADAGDKKAQKKWGKISKKVVKLHVKASKGNLKAAKTLAMLTPTGLFVTSVGPKVLKTTMKGSFVGKDEILGTFVGGDSITEINGNAKLTEIITSGGAFVGNDKLAEIIGWGWSSLNPLNVAKKVITAPINLSKKALQAGYKYNPATGKYSAISVARKAPGASSVTSGEFIGEEERALAAEGGACERAALKRRGRRSV